MSHTAGCWVRDGSLPTGSNCHLEFSDVLQNLLANCDVPVATRLQLTHALIFSKGDYGSAAWPELTAQEARRHHSSHLKVLRVIARKERWREDAGTDASVISLLGTMMPRLGRTVARLSLFARAVVGRVGFAACHGDGPIIPPIPSSLTMALNVN